MQEESTSRKRIRFAIARAVYGWLEAVDVIDKVDAGEVEIFIACMVDVLEYADKFAKADDTCS